MQIGSEITYCPSPVYWPTPILAFAGLAGRSLAGEDMGEGRKSDLPGALLGFTEKDRQPGLRQSVRLEVQAHPAGHAHHRKDRFRKGQYS